MLPLVFGSLVLVAVFFDMLILWSSFVAEVLFFAALLLLCWLVSLRQCFLGLAFCLALGLCELLLAFVPSFFQADGPLVCRSSLVSCFFCRFSVGFRSEVVWSPFWLVVDLVSGCLPICGWGFLCSVWFSWCLGALSLSLSA